MGEIEHNPLQNVPKSRNKSIYLNTGPSIMKQGKILNFDLAYTGWILLLLGNCAKDWKHHISIFKYKIWGEKTLETFQWIQPPSAQISRWSSTNLLTEENVMKKTDISQKYYNTKSEKATYLFIFPPTDQNFCRWQPATLIFFMLLLLKGDSTVHQQNNL